MAVAKTKKVSRKSLSTKVTPVVAGGKKAKRAAKKVSAKAVKRNVRVSKPDVSVKGPKVAKAVHVGKVSGAAAKHPHAAAVRTLREYGLTFPEAHLKSPWPGHLDLAVRNKTFAYLSIEGEPLGVSCKLPQSASAALALSFAEPTAYGLGKSGWVSAKFPESEEPPVEFLKTWIEESYRAQAPKALVKQLK